MPPGARPVSDRAREGLFASLGSRVEGARCLDLFAGTGAVGIEALSRGASFCTFVDASRAAGTAIRENLERTGLADAAAVRVRDVLDWLRGEGQGELGSPYLDRCVEELDAGVLGAAGWTVVVTRGQKGSLPAVPLHWGVARQLRYGDSLLTLYREERWA